MLKRAAKYLGYFFVFLLAFSAVYAVCAWSFSRITVNADVVNTEPDEVAIYILTNGMHTDLVLPVKNDVADWTPIFRYEHTLGKDTTAPWVGLGWGDQGIYLDTPTWDDLTFETAFKAAFFLSESAVHATFFKQLTEDESTKKIQMTKAEYARLARFIKDTLEWKDGAPIYINTTAQYGETDAFYESHGTYNVTHTCNTWANNGLKASGQKAALWTPFDTGIFRHYQ